MPICADCKAAPGGICFHHLVESSFDAPTEDEKTIAELRARAGKLEAENQNLGRALASALQAPRLFWVGVAEYPDEGWTPVTATTAEAAIAVAREGKYFGEDEKGEEPQELEAHAIVEADVENLRTMLEDRDERIRALEAGAPRGAEILVDGPHGRPEEDRLVRMLRANRGGKFRTKELLPIAEAGLLSRRELAARMAGQAMKIQSLEAELLRWIAGGPVVVPAGVLELRKSFVAAFVESTIGALESQPRVQYDDDSGRLERLRLIAEEVAAKREEPK